MRLLLSLVLLFVVASPSLHAEAAPIQIDFTGTVSAVTAGVRVLGSLNFGEPVIGRVVFDDGLADDGTGFYYDAVLSFSLSVGGYLVSETVTPLANDNFVHVEGGLSGVPPTDTFATRAPVSGALVRGFAPELAQFALVSFDDHFSGTAIPDLDALRAFTPEEINRHGLNFLTFESTDFQRVEWRIDSFAIVPEPTVWALSLISGFLSLVRLTRR